MSSSETRNRMCRAHVFMFLYFATYQHTTNSFESAVPEKAMHVAKLKSAGVGLHKTTTTIAAPAHARHCAVFIGIEDCQIRKADVLDANSVDCHAKTPRALHMRYGYALALIQSAATARHQTMDTNFVTWVDGSPLPCFYCITKASICAPHRLCPLQLRCYRSRVVPFKDSQQCGCSTTFVKKPQLITRFASDWFGSLTVCAFQRNAGYYVLFCSVVQGFRQ